METENPVQKQQTTYFEGRMSIKKYSPQAVFFTSTETAFNQYYSYRIEIFSPTDSGL